MVPLNTQFDWDTVCVYKIVEMAVEPWKNDRRKLTFPKFQPIRGKY